jgi:hypothetical protein
MAMQCISPEVTVKCCKKCCIPNATDESDTDTSWNDNEKDGDVLGMSVRKVKALNVKTETVTLIGKGR